MRRPADLSDDGAIYDTGATLAALLGLDFPVCWIGRPYDVFCPGADFTR